MYLNRFLLEPQQMAWDVKLIYVLSGNGNGGDVRKYEIHERRQIDILCSFQGHR